MENSVSFYLRISSKTYSANSIKVITGVAVDKESIKLPNRRHKLLADTYARAINAETQEERAAAILELRGRINEADQIDPSAVHLPHRRLAQK